MSDLTKIVLVDCNRLVRAGLALLIENRGGLTVLAEADNCWDALSQPELAECDVVLWCMDSPSEECISAIRQVADRAPHAKILLLASGLEPRSYADAVRNGVHGIIDTAEEAEVLIKALRKVKNGEVWLDRQMMIGAISDLRREMDSFRSGTNGAKSMALSEREREVLGLVCQGFKNKQIADHLFISPATVRHHLTSIFNKLDVSDRLELVLYAFRNRIAEPPR